MIQQCVMKLKDSARLETEGMSTMVRAIRCAVEVRPERKGTAKEQTTEQEQGKKVSFIEEDCQVRRERKAPTSWR